MINSVLTVCLTPGDRFRIISGERGRNRTFNLVIKSHLLCQLSYAPVPVGCATDVATFKI